MSEIKCKKCNSDMVLTNCPKTLFEFIIPFTRKRFAIQLWDWDNEEPVCLECASSRERDYQERIYYQGFDDGIKEATENRDERY